MTGRDLDKKLEKVKVTLKAERELLQLYLIGFEEAEKNYIKSKNKFLKQYKEIEKRIDGLHFEIRGLLKDGK